MFINCSNHSSKNWSEKQLTEAHKWGEIVDYPFPNVSSKLNKEEVEELANQVVEEIVLMKPSAVMCQGEFTLSFHIISKLKALNINVVSACSERKVIEYQDENKNTKKITEFCFVKFREY